MKEKERVEAAFSAAALSYDPAADLQKHTARRLAGLIGQRGVRDQPAVLELGCGTGGLTRELWPLVQGTWLVTDLAQGMVQEAARQHKDLPQARFCAMDAEHPAVPRESFDLVVSNLMAQWMGDLRQSLERQGDCLVPGGLLAFSMLGSESFPEWREAHRKAGVSWGVRDYPSAEGLKRMLPQNAEILVETVPVVHADARAFVAGLKQIGAGTPAEGYRPMTAGRMRAVLREAGVPMTATYQVLYAQWVKGP